MDSKETKKYVYPEKRKAAAQLRHRDTYSQISSDRRKELLLARRIKKSVPEQPTSSCCRPRVPKQAALTIREPPLLLEKAVHAQPSVGTSANKKKRKGYMQPLCDLLKQTISACD